MRQVKLLIDECQSPLPFSVLTVWFLFLPQLVNVTIYDSLCLAWFHTVPPLENAKRHRPPISQSWQFNSFDRTRDVLPRARQFEFENHPKPFFLHCLYLLHVYDNRLYAVRLYQKATYDTSGGKAWINAESKITHSAKTPSSSLAVILRSPVRDLPTYTECDM